MTILAVDITNFAIGVASFAVFIITVLIAGRLGKEYLFGLSICFILISNITVQINVEVFPGVTISWAIIIYSLVYLITDLVIEFYGKNTAYKLATVNLWVQLILWFYVWLSLKVTPVQENNSLRVYETMRGLFATTAQVTMAAVVASIGPFTDIFTTSRIRQFLERWNLFKNETLNLIARSKLSTIVGELVNTVAFFTLASVGTGSATKTVVWIVIWATLAKWAIAFADTPFLWIYFSFIGPPGDAEIRKRKEANDL